MPTTRAAARRLPDVWHSGVLQAISRHTDEPTLLRMTMLSASVRREMLEPSFKLHTGLCWSVRLDFAKERDDDDVPRGCVGEGRRRRALALPFMQYAGEVCERMIIFDSTETEVMAICKLCPRLKKLCVSNARRVGMPTWPSPRVRAIARVCPLLEQVELMGLPLQKVLPHFGNLRVVEFGPDADNGQLTKPAEAAVCRFLKRQRATEPGIALEFTETAVCPSAALISAVGDAPITKVSIFESGVDLESTRRMLAACTSLKTLVLYGFGRFAQPAPAVELVRLVTACPSITALSLCESGVDDDGALLEGLTRLTELQTLKLHGRLYLSRAGAEVLHTRAHFPRLAELQADFGAEPGWVDTAETLQRIVDARPALRILTVSERCFPADADVLEYELPFEATLRARGGAFRFDDPESWDPDNDEDC